MQSKTAGEPPPAQGPQPTPHQPTACRHPPSCLTLASLAHVWLQARPGSHCSHGKQQQQWQHPGWQGGLGWVAAAAACGASLLCCRRRLRCRLLCRVVDRRRSLCFASLCVIVCLWTTQGACRSSCSCIGECTDAGVGPRARLEPHTTQPPLLAVFPPLCALRRISLYWCPTSWGRR